MCKCTLTLRWDKEKIKHFRYLESDGEKKRIVVTAIRSLHRANNSTRRIQQDFRIYQKLDGVGPVDNRPSTDT